MLFDQPNMEGALDLSAKPQDIHNKSDSHTQLRETYGISFPSNSPSPHVKKESPSPAQTSDTESHGDRDSPSTHNDSLDKDIDQNPPTQTQPVMPNHMSFGRLPTSLSVDTGGDTNGTSNSSPSRPFKMYPLESGGMPAMFPTPTTPMAAPGMVPYGSALSGPIGFSPLDITSMAMNSPLTSYLYQRKRKNDQRDSGSTVSPPLPSNASQSPSLPPEKKQNTGIPDERKDSAYWERRRKNNDAAKRSRDARRAKEEEIAFRAALLEQENLKLKAQVAILKSETQKLHMLLYQRM